MKQLSAISLLICFLLPVMGMTGWLKYEQYSVRKKVKRQIIAGLDKKELVLLKFSKKEILSQLTWEHSKEFEYRHEMYDVVDSEMHGDSIWYWCWWDHEETLLNKQLNMLAVISFDQAPPKKNSRAFIDFVLEHLFFAPYEIHLSIRHHTISEPVYKHFFYRVLRMYTTPPVPPPEF